MPTHELSYRSSGSPDPVKKITDLALIPVLQMLLLPVRGLKRNVASDKIRQQFVSFMST
jgi:hypothetical protein